MDKPTEYAQVFTDGGGDPTFAELDGFLFTHFNARAVYISDLAEQARDTGGLREAMLLIEPERYEEAGRPGKRTWFDVDRAWQMLRDLSQGAAHEERGLDVPTNIHERSRLYPHPHIPFGACRLCALLARLATPEAAPDE